MFMLANIWALIGLIGIPVLVGIYLLRSRFRSRQVSSLFLWQTLVQSREGGRRVRSLQPTLLFLLEILAILFIVLAAADPQWPILHAGRPVTVVLDDSASMMAAGRKGTSRDRALAALERVLDQQAFRAVRFVIAGTVPGMAGSSVPVSGAIAYAKEIWNCRAPSPDLGGAIAIALQTAGRHGCVLVLSDHAPDTLPEGGRIRWISAGEKVENTGFVSAVRTAGAGEDRIFAQILNASERETAVTLEKDLGPGAVEKQIITIGPGETGAISFTVSASVDRVSMRLPDDAFAADNSVVLMRKPVVPVCVRVNVSDSAAGKKIEQALASSGMVSLHGNPVELWITDKPKREMRENDAWILHIQSSARTNVYAGPFVVDFAHQLADGLNLNGVVWAGAETNELAGVPIVSAGNTALLTVEEMGLRSQLIRLQAGTDLSTLTDTPNWPILFWNLLQWRSSARPGMHEFNARAGVQIRFSAPPDVREVILKRPDGSETRHMVLQGQSSFVPGIAGIYRVLAGEKEFPVSINFISAEESNLLGASAGDWGKWDHPDVKSRLYASTAWLWGLLALLMLAAHLMVATRWSVKG
jgi:hypothetical protein